MRVRVVVVAWNSGRYLSRCLEHLEASPWEGGELEIVVVDNGSTDGSTDGWEEHHPTIELRSTGGNLGFAGGANVGLRDRAGIDAIALVNPDAFVDAGWLTPLATALEADPGLGAACPKILFEAPDDDGHAVINNVGNILGPTYELHDRGCGERDIGQYDAPEDVWGWCGGAVLLSCKYLDDVGVFDARLFLYAEDCDLSWRGRRRGWRYRYEPASVVRHVHRGSSGGERTPLLDYLNRRNRLVVVTRHARLRGTATAWSRALGGIVVELLTNVIVPSVRGRRTDTAPLRRRCRAFLDALRLLLGGDPPLPGVVVGPASSTP